MGNQSEEDLMWRDHLKIAIVKFYPWLDKIWTDENGIVKATGIFPKFLELLASAANFTYELYGTETLEPGQKMDNGSWTGAGGLLQQKAVDMFFPWAEPRVAGLLSSWPVVMSDTKMLASLGQPETASFIGFLFTFDSEIWYYMFALIIGTIFISALFDLYHEGEKLRFQSFIKRIDYYVWVFLSAIFCEGSEKIPKSRRSQFLLGIWLLAILTMMNAFSGQFKAQLMKQKEEDRIQTPGDLADRPHLVPILAKETTVQFSFQNSPIEDYQRVWRISQGYGNISIMHMDNYQNIDIYQRAKEGKAVIVFEITSMTSFYNKICDKLVGNRKIYISEPNLDFVMVTFSTRPGIPKKFLGRFNKMLERMTEAHLAGKMIADAIWTSKPCEESSSEPALGLKNLLPIFYLLFFLNGFAFIICLLEIWVYNKFPCCKCSTRGIRGFYRKNSIS